MKSQLILALVVLLSGCSTLPDGHPRFLLVSHDIAPLGSDVVLSVTLKLDSATGEVWRRRPIAFNPVPVEPRPTNAHALKHEPSLKMKQLTAATTIRLSQIIIPRIQFQKSSFPEVVELLSAVLSDNDSSRERIFIDVDYPQKQLSTTNAVDPFQAAMSEPDFESIPLITFSAKSMPFLDALELVCSVSGMRYSIVGESVLLSPHYIVNYAFVDHHRTLRPSTVARLKSQSPRLFDLDVSREDLNKRWRSYFEELGINWPRGSRFEFHPLLGKIWVFNTPGNLDRIDNIINQLEVYPPRRGRYQLTIATDSSLMLFDTDTGEAWQYHVIRLSGGNPSIEEDRFVHIPREGRQEPTFQWKP